jgi:hypothetical protein
LSSVNLARRFYYPVLIVVAVLFSSLPAYAQSGELSDDEIELNIASFGIGGLAREGEWAGVLVTMQDKGSSSRDIVLRLEIPDIDGDITQYDRVVTANPGVLQSFWLYCQLPFQSTGDEYELKAFEAIDSGGSDDPAEIGFRAGQLLGQRQILTSQVMTSRVGLIGIVGSTQVGLDQYGVRVQNQPWMPYGHELQRTSAGLTIDNLPDRWHGLKSLNTLVWSTSTTASYDPSRLTPEKARAIREWVERGGHFVVVLQSSGDPWYQGAHPLRTILPAVKNPNRLEGVSLDEYRSLLTESAAGNMPQNAVVYTFDPLDGAEQHEAMPVLQSQSGETVVTRRLLGSGMVTAIGLPLNEGTLRRLGLPQPEPLWHRILGLRGNVVSPEAINEQQSIISSRNPQIFDDGVSGAISKTGTAVQGVLFGIIVFLVYWLLAGPVGYALLKQRKKPQHAWVAFVACIAGFTAIAWLGATTLRPKRVTISHFSMLQQVHGQDTQRVRSWLSVMLPDYGDATISSVDPETSVSTFGGQESANILVPWSAPEDSGGTLAGGFPDNSGYRIQSRAPAAVRIPTRATVKTFTSEWSGDENWRMPYVVGDPGALEEPALTIDSQVVTGRVAHRLPGALKDVRIFVVSRTAPIRRIGQRLDRGMIARVSVLAPNFGDAGWAPDRSIELADLTRIDEGNRRTREDRYFEQAVRMGVDTTGLGGAQGSLTDRMVAGMFLSQFEPPRFDGAATDPVGERLAIRRMTHGWDLGRWFTQPCVIITGVLEIDVDDASEDGIPTPVWVDGRRVPSSGTTVVTWVYPLDAAPPLYSESGTPDTDETDGEG